MSDIQEEGYSPEEIYQATEELKSLTPEGLLDLHSELDRARTNLVMPEAVAIAFTDVFTSNGNKINIAARGMTGRQTIDELADMMRYAREKYGMNPPHVLAKESTEPQYVPDAQSEATQPSTVIDVDVTSITRERKHDGKGDFLRVRGGMYTKYGFAAYDNVYPKGFDITKLQYGVEVTTVPPEFAHAKVNTNKPVRTISFYS